MHFVPKFHLFLLLSALFFTANICSVVIGATTSSFSHKDHVPCTASLDPQHLIARKFANDSAFEVIRCSARVGNELIQFNNPVFDISFGFSPSSGIFILRGKNVCSPNKELCWSDFKISGQALRELLLPAKSDSEEDNAINGDDSASSQNRMTNAVIDFTCNVADASRNTTVRCLDSGSIRYANVIRFGQRCLNSVNSESECGHRMTCASGRCVCDKGNIPIELSKDETVCQPKASLSERCNFTRQCQNENSLCEFDSGINAKICKCLSDFEEVRGAQNKLYCAPVKPTQKGSSSSTSSTPATTVEQDETVVAVDGGKDGNGDVVLFDNESPSTQEEQDAKMSQATDLKDMLLKLGKNNQVGLIVFAGVILLAILLVVLIINVRNRGEMQVEKHNNGKLSSNEKSKRNNSRDGPLLGAVHQLSDDEEIDVRIDEHAEDEVKIDDQQLIDINQENNHQVRQKEFSDTSASNQSLNQANFNYSAKQSVV